MEYKNYFETFNKEWIDDAYKKNGYNYPVGQERLNILKNIIREKKINNLKVLDIGCGDGSISFELLKAGCSVIGVDRSESMIELCCNKKMQLSQSEQAMVNFKCIDFSEIPTVFKDEQFDLVVAFGLIGYLDSDKFFFEVISSVVHESSLLVLSWRNSYFNFFTGSKYTRKEIEQANTDKYSQFYKLLSTEVSVEKHILFLKELKKILNQIDLDQIQILDNNFDSDVPDDLIEARQHDYKTLVNEGEVQGWGLEKMYSVHPHLLPTTLNKQFPPYMYNLISEALSVYYDESISFAWSSVGVGLFSKQGEI